jgi:predicted ABC-type ATPase
VDSWQMYDRSGLTHRLIASGRAGGTVIVEDQRSWTDLLEKSR